LTNAHSSERVLKLELITESVSNSDDDGDGIPNNKDNNTAINKIQAGARLESLPIAPNNILVFVGLVMVLPAPAWILLIAVLLSLLLGIPSPS
jgi:hypothetical protein